MTALVWADITLLVGDVLFGREILALPWYMALLAGVTLYLMFGCLVAMMLLSTGLLAPMQRHCRRGVVSSILWPWSTTIMAMIMTPVLLHGREWGEGSTRWEKSRIIPKK